MKKILNTLLLISAFIIILSLWGFYWGIRPLKLTSHVTPENFQVKYESISFRTSDDVLIHGWFIPNKNPKAKTIIFLHGYPADKGNILPSMIYLHKNYNLLFFDFRYFGESEGLYTTVGKNEVLDLLAAIRYLQTRDIHEVGFWGFSLGGAVALMTAPNAPEIKAIVAESSFAQLDWMLYEYYHIPLLRYPLAWLTRLWGIVFLRLDVKSISPASSAKNITIPVLLIHSYQDTMIPIKHGVALQKSLAKNPTVKILFETDISHGEMITNHEKIIKDFFDDNLK
jgi:dipeptidyl aminopeptidase/acylaminoacyl peptidase